jgi:Ni,Fe-hydrogenase maturation factor
MRTLFIAVGNPWRGDDGAAHAVLKRLDHAECRSLVQLVPELAAEIAGFDQVVFIDADVSAATVCIESIPDPQASAVTHVMSTAEVVELSRTLFGFRGCALQCRIPATDVSYRDGLSRGGTFWAECAARLLAKRLPRARIKP